MKLLQLVFLLIFMVSYPQQAPVSGFQITKGKKIQIKFQFVNNLILIPVRVNGVELTFLLDSGVNETILFSLDNKKVSLRNVSKIKFSGLGESDEIEGLESVHNNLQVGDGFEDPNHSIYIILDQDIDLSEHLGVPVNGIIGYTFFKNHPILINFLKKRITVYKNRPKTTRRFKKFPLSIEGNKPYLWGDVKLTDLQESAKLLMDLGNSDAVWLFPYVAEEYISTHPFIEDYLGSGFNGDIMGKRGRMHRLSLGSFEFEKPLMVVPDSSSIRNLRMVPKRKGSIGNEIFRRFEMLVDYPEGTLYLRKNKDFSEPFLFNKSGIEIKQQGFTWEEGLVPVDTRVNEPSTLEGIKTVRIVPQKFQYKFVLKPNFVISNCRINSPCDKAGLQKGDEILLIDGRKINDLSLQKINKMLTEGTDGTSVSLEIRRNNKIFKSSVTLEDPIPYRNSIAPSNR